MRAFQFDLWGTGICRRRRSPRRNTRFVFTSFVQKNNEKKINEKKNTLICQNLSLITTDVHAGRQNNERKHVTTCNSFTGC